MEPIRILYINGGIMDRGGISTYMMNYYRNMDRSKIQIDFVVHGFEKGSFDDEIRSMGGIIYNIPVKSKNYLGNINELRKIFNSGKYKIVHSHMDAMGYIALKEAKKTGIPIRIAHSHSTRHMTTNKIKYILNEYARSKITKYATHFFACSNEAGKWLYGDKLIDNVKIIHNAIDLDKFSYNESKQNNIIPQVNLNDNIVFGHVGHFNYIKNHDFLIDIFKEINEMEENVLLMLVGDGEYREDIYNKVKRLGLSNKVLFLGIRKDISSIMNVMDVFILPSIFEGLPVVGIEAQAKSLQCFISDSVTNEIAITDNVTFLSLNSSAKEWANIIISKLKLLKKQDMTQQITEAGYNIKLEAEKLADLYISMHKKEV